MGRIDGEDDGCTGENATGCEYSAFHCYAPVTSHSMKYRTFIEYD